MGKDYKWRYISEEFDRKFGTSYSRKWAMPSGRDERELFFEKMYVDPVQFWVGQDGKFTYEQNRNASALYSDLVRLNPELAGHPWLPGWATRATMAIVVWGVLSRYSREDIFAFISEGNREIVLKRWRRLQKRYNFDARGWVPSRKNLEEIQRMLRGGKEFLVYDVDQKFLHAWMKIEDIQERSPQTAIKLGMIYIRLKGWRKYTRFRNI